MIFSTTKSRLFRCQECGKIVYKNHNDKFTNIDYENLCDKCFYNKFKIEASIKKLLSQTEQEIKERILSKLPEKQFIRSGFVKDKWKLGYNHALKEITNLINNCLLGD
jgi:hypothetical protein